MKPEQFIQELSEVKDHYIEEADPEKKPAARTGLRWAAAAAVLVLAIGGTAVFALTRGGAKTSAASDPSDAQLYGQTDAAQTPTAAEAPEVPAEAELEGTGVPDDIPDDIEPPEVDGTPTPTGIDPSALPKITLSDSFSGSYGFEGYLAYTIDELANGNPWNAENSPIYLPVYRNHAYDLAGFPTGLDEQALYYRLDELLASWLIDSVENLRPLYETVYDGDREEERFYALQGEGDGFTVTLLANGTTEIRYNDGLALPEQLVFRYDSTEEQADACMEWLIETYTKRLSIPHPRKALFGDRDIYGTRNFRYCLYDESINIEQAILNYAFRQVQFCPDEDGKLVLIRIYDGLAAAEQLGIYPIISPDSAKNLLYAGHYATSVPHAFTGAEEIAKVELVYRTGPGEQTLLPYYRFYVDITDIEGLAPDYRDGLRDFGAYYVPAVDSFFIENMPTYDGSFN